jgi:hypothetical protein
MKFATAIFALTIASASAAVFDVDLSTSAKTNPAEDSTALWKAVEGSSIHQLTVKDTKSNVADVAKTVFYGPNTVGVRIEEKGPNYQLMNSEIIYNRESNEEKMKELAMDYAQRLGVSAGAIKDEASDIDDSVSDEESSSDENNDSSTEVL